MSDDKAPGNLNGAIIYVGYKVWMIDDFSMHPEFLLSVFKYKFMYPGG